MVKGSLRFLQVSAADPEDARRRSLLNIMLFGVGLIDIIYLFLMVGLDISTRDGGFAEFAPLYAGGIAVLLGTAGTYMVNRFVSGPIASTLFLLMFLAIAPIVDDPEQVANGRALFIFVVPVVMASVLMKPYWTFLYAGLSSTVASVIALSINQMPNIPAILGFFIIALVCWLSARSLESALYQLMVINKELDQRVAERTKALSEVLWRERAEAVKNQAILDDITDGVMLFDQEDRAIVANPAMSQLVDQSSDQILGRTLEDWLFHSNIGQRDIDSVYRYIKEPHSADGKLKVQWGEKTLAINVAPVHLPDGEPVGRVAVFHDFTREAELDSMKNDFLAMVSHELRTPMNSILGYVEMLNEGIYGRLEERQAGVIERIITNTHRLLAIVNDLLDQAQIEGGRLRLQNCYFTVSELADHLRAGTENIVQAKGLRLEIEVSSDLPDNIYGDPQRLHQVLVNLVGNAVKFTNHGSIRVKLFRYSAESWAVQVIDTGVGISPEAQKYIFDPFRQVNMEITRRHGGIGLGLSIVKRLVTLMQGDIFLTSQPGKGSTFTIVLPFIAAEKETVNYG